jgi:putative transposase
VKYAWIESQRDFYELTLMCRLLGVSRSGFHAAQGRAPSPRAIDDGRILERIRTAQGHHRGRYGWRRMGRELHRTASRSTSSGWAG